MTMMMNMVAFPSIWALIRFLELISQSRLAASRSGAENGIHVDSKFGLERFYAHLCVSLAETSELFLRVRVQSDCVATRTAVTHHNSCSDALRLFTPFFYFYQLVLPFDEPSGHKVLLFFIKAIQSCTATTNDCAPEFKLLIIKVLFWSCTLLAGCSTRPVLG